MRLVVGLSVPIRKQPACCTRCLSSTARLEKRSPSSSLWLQRQRKDPLVSKAVVDRYRCRSAYKLIEMDNKHRFLKRGSIVVDCGARPGAWSQVAAQRVIQYAGLVRGEAGLQHRWAECGGVIAIDIEGIEPLPGVHIMEKCDLTSRSVCDRILRLLNSCKANVVMSDMAPNASGIRALDHQRIMELGHCAYDLAKLSLKDGGTFLCKLWQGALVNGFKEELRENFERVEECRLKSTRSDSSEIYIIAHRYVYSNLRNNELVL